MSDTSLKGVSRMRTIRPPNLSYLLYKIREIGLKHEGKLNIDIKKASVDGEHFRGVFKEILQDIASTNPLESRTRLDVLKMFSQNAVYYTLKDSVLRVADAYASKDYHKADVLSFRLILERKPQLKAFISAIMENSTWLKDYMELKGEDRKVTRVQVSIEFVFETFFEKKFEITGILSKILEIDIREHLLADIDRLFDFLNSQSPFRREDGTRIALRITSNNTLRFELTISRSRNLWKFWPNIESTIYEFEKVGGQIFVRKPRIIGFLEDILRFFPKYGFFDNNLGDHPLNDKVITVLKDILQKDMELLTDASTLNVKRLHEMIPEIDIILNPQRKPGWQIFISLLWKSKCELQKTHMLSSEDPVSTMELCKEISNSLDVNLYNFIKATDILREYNPKGITWHHVSAVLTGDYSVPMGKEEIKILTQYLVLPFEDFPGGSHQNGN